MSHGAGGNPHMRRIAIVAAAALAACVGGAGANPRQSVIVDGVYSLAKIGDRDLETRAQNQRSCSLRPYWGRFTLRSPSWVDAESLFINCKSDGSAAIHVRGTLGSFRMRAGDTIDFFATEAGRDSTIPVFSGILRGATLRVMSDNEGAGDYVYTRRSGTR